MTPDSPTPGPTRNSTEDELSRTSVLSFNVLALDMGNARIGVAFKAAGQTLVLPIAVVPAAPESQSFDRLRRMIAERDIRVVVVGLPIHADQTQADRVRKSIRRLRKGVRGVRWRFHDETLTSSAAADIGRDLGERPQGRPDDDRAAALILEGFMDSLPRS